MSRFNSMSQSWFWIEFSLAQSYAISQYLYVPLFGMPATTTTKPTQTYEQYKIAALQKKSSYRDAYFLDKYKLETFYEEI